MLDFNTELEKLENRWAKRLERERRARKEAEQLLEAKSLELFQANQRLQHLAQELEVRIAERTEELSTALSHAKQATQAKSEFLATMSHEIRTPLNGVLGMTELLKSTPLNSEQHHYLDTLTSCGQTLLSLISDILDVSKIEAGKLELEQIPFRPGQLIQELQAIFSTQIKQKNLRFTLDLSPNLPEWLLGDPTRLRQIFFNLLSNAIKFTHRGEITLGWHPDHHSPQFWQAYVRDTGIGIAPAQRERLFQAFSQVDSSISRRYGGSGLGLVICRHLAEAMQGELGLHSQAGEGSTFFFSFQAAQVQPHSDNQDSAQTSTPNLDQLRVLLVEDNPVNQMLTLKLLEKMGIQARLAENGSEAIDQIQSHFFDLILMDMQMPVMDGLAATYVIRRLEDIHQPIILALTANAFAEDREKCQQAGMNGFLTKPINLKSLQQEILQHFPAATQG